MANNPNPFVNINPPNKEWKMQSPFLYLQSAGSNGADSSTPGAHVRWLYLRNLGDTHLPKANYATTLLNFNKKNDFLALYRSLYNKRFPTLIDFSVAPGVVVDAQAFWIYLAANTNTNTTVYIYFRDAARYASVRAVVDPAVNPQLFVQKYCPGLIEAEVKDKLFFAAEFVVQRTAATVLRTEALTVEENVPLSPVFVSCRQRYDNEHWCGKKSQSAAASVAAPPAQPPCCAGPNLLVNGNFENGATGFQTDYTSNMPVAPGNYYITGDAHALYNPWNGFPHSGKAFMAVDGHIKKNKNVWVEKIQVTKLKQYCFSGYVTRLWGDDPITLQITIKGNSEPAQVFQVTIPATVGVWEFFTFSWSSVSSGSVQISIMSLSTESSGNDFGLDDLWFCESAAAARCNPRIVSENIRSVRFDVDHGYPTALEIETYDDYVFNTKWETLGNFALTKDNPTAFDRLEPAAGSVNGAWLKYNDNAFVNVANYKDRWTRSGGLGYGVDRYITLSDTDPMAIDSLMGDVQPQDGSVEVSMLDMLRTVSMDFHVARMFGLGHLDRNINNDNDAYIYLGLYDTNGALDDTNVKRQVRHYYMGIPTRRVDYRLPDKPTMLPLTYGLTVDNGGPQPTLLTDAQGYTPDGLSRYINLFVASENNDDPLGPFFVPPLIFCGTEKTSSVFYGVEYRKQLEPNWRKPEIAHDEYYKDLDSPQQFETLALPNNADPTKPILIHEEQENGFHEYAAYGINWFSRISPLSPVVTTDKTVFTKANRLLPPSNLHSQLIQQESPLLLTSANEQVALAALPGPDKTLVRVTFDYFHTHDTNYDYGDKVELMFRSEMPRNVVGAIKSVVDDTDPRRSIVRTEDYLLNSSGTVLSPTLLPALYPNFVGGVLSCGQVNFLITAVAAGASGEGPMFTVLKLVNNQPVDPDASGTFYTSQDYTPPTAPDPSSSAQIMFMAVENMTDTASWGTPNPLTTTISIGDSTWTTQTETYTQDGDTVTAHLRGVWANATVVHTPLATAVNLYQINFQTYHLLNHPQSAAADPVQWYNGVVRVAKVSDPSGRKKVLEVIKVEHIGDGMTLVLHALDNTYDPADPIITSSVTQVNYYPGYKVYLHADTAVGFTDTAILPAAGEGSRKTWIGGRSVDTTEGYYSPVGIPTPIVAQEFIDPIAPEQPSGAEYATRPDFYYKSSYTYRMNFAHKPFSVVMYRANEEAILRALYSDTTYTAVRAQLDALGRDDEYFSDRWKNLMGFDYVYDTPGHPYYDPTYSNVNGTFRKFPRETGYAFPNPDKGGALNGSAPGSILADLKAAIYGAFTPLTDYPLLYDFIKDSTYTPTPKKQHIRNNSGVLLAPSDPEFEMAPMAKRTGSGYEVQFTDFTLDGTGNNYFFYCGREIGNRGKIGDPSPVAGPIQLINTRPPDEPGIKKLFTVQFDPITETGPTVNFEVNAYPVVQQVDRMLIYRTSDPAAALTVRTMELVKTIDFAESTQTDTLNKILRDDFENGFIPYGDPLFYRVIAMRSITNADGDPDWAPSQPSKLLLTTVIDVVNPEAPTISYTSDPLSGSPAVLGNVHLSWPTTTYNGTYYLETMNSAGNWNTIYRIKTNDPAVAVDLAATDLGTNILPKQNMEENWPIYNRFRVRVENSSGLFNLEQVVLTI